MLCSSDLNLCRKYFEVESRYCHCTSWATRVVMGQVEEDAAFVVTSPHRTKVLRRLTEGDAIPAQIREDTGQEYSRISEAANSLRERNLIELVVPDDTKRGRLYSITDHGTAAWGYMEKNNMVGLE